MKGVRFWGCRGSLPVALTAAGVRAKLTHALSAARAADLASPQAIDSFIDSLPFAVRGGYGGHSSCVQILTRGSDHFICDMGSGLRPFGQHAMAQRQARAGQGQAQAQTFHIFMSHLHWDHIMGLPFFVPAFVPGQPRAHLRQPPAARGRAAPAAGAAVVSGRLLDLRCGDGVRAPRTRAARRWWPACR